jgi:Fe-S-cluster containining protein
MHFPCVRCGLCCQQLNFIPFLSDYNRGDGICCHLKNNLCSIYNKRPIICNVENAYNKYFKRIMTKNDFIKINLEVCLKLIKTTNNTEVENKIINLISQLN